ncbi:flagellar biosynthetic protein FlhB [bacterium BMS3Bbin02]|nr:flagellar biosynthetic protein FlhB [bacterium BMS3Bbin02]
MARSQDKTEKPTDRRKRDARREGRVAKSQEVGAALSLIGLVLTVRFLGPRAGDAIASQSARLFANADLGLEAGVANGVGNMVLVGLIPFLGLSVLLGIAGGVGQVGFSLAPKALQPKLSNLSFKRGLQKLKPSTAAWELVRSVIKLGGLFLVVWGPMQAWLPTIGAPLGLLSGIESTGSQITGIIIRAAILAVVIAGADYAVVRFRQGKELKMTKEELKKEMKDQDGDPLIKGQRRRRAAEMTRGRMLIDVALADIVVTNPTHLSVALRYDADEGAPKVLAKGAGDIAKKIRHEAYRNGVTVLEDKPLARALFRKVKVGSFVPAALYEAVAVVLAVAYRRRGRRAA